MIIGAVALVLADPIHLRYFANFYVEPMSWWLALPKEVERTPARAFAYAQAQARLEAGPPQGRRRPAQAGPAEVHEAPLREPPAGRSSRGAPPGWHRDWIQTTV